MGDQIFKLGLQSSDAKAKIAAQILKGVTDLAKVRAGDPLHQFGSGTSDEERKKIKAQISDYSTMKDYNQPDNRRDTFEVDMPSEGLTLDDIQESMEIAEALFDQYSHGKDAEVKKKPGWSLFGNKKKAKPGGPTYEASTTKLDADNRTAGGKYQTLL